MRKRNRTAFILWSVYSLVTFTIMLAHTSDEPQVLGRYSTNYLALLLVFIGIYSLSALYSLFAPFHDLTEHAVIRLRTTPVGAWAGYLALLAGAALFWVFAPVSNVEFGPLMFRLYVVTTLLIISVWWLDGTTAGSTSRPSRRAYWAWAALALAVALALTLRARMQPPHFFDEGLVSIYAVSWIQSGDPTHYPPIPVYRAFLFTSVSAYTLGQWLNVFGISFETARAWSVTFGLLALIPLAVLFRARPFRWTLLAALAFGALFVLSGNVVRYDAFVPILLALALYAYFLVSAEDRSRWWMHLVVGFLFGFTAEGHQLAARFGLAVGLLYLWRIVQTYRVHRRLDYVPLVSFAAGVAGYGLFYALSRMLLWRFGLPELLDEIVQAYSLEVTIGGVLSPLERVLNAMQSLLGTYTANYAAALIMMSLATILAVVTRDRILRLTMVIYWLSNAVLFWMNPKPHNFLFYNTHTLPLIVIAVYRSLRIILRWRGQRVALALAVFVLVIGVAQPLFNARSRGVRELLDAGIAINERLPEDAAVVMGPEHLWWGLNQRVFYDVDAYENLTAATALEPVDAFIIIERFHNQFPLIHDFIAANDLERSFCLSGQDFGQIAVYVRQGLAHENQEGCAA